MLNFNSEFVKFNENIKISKNMKDTIITSRNAVRDKIRNYFKNELKCNQPKFKIQGSFTINTALKPLENQEVDIDDGVYLQHITDEDEWPTPIEIHQEIINALENHTQSGCESKTSCVRVIYKNDYHIDLPVYMMKDDKAFLGQTKGNKWINSDSKKFRNWFYENRENEQVNRIIRYLKGWRDYMEINITSIEISILCIENFEKKDNRDDLSLFYTLDKIINKINQNRSLYKPVSPFENLWEDFSESKIDKHIKIYEDLYSDLDDALNNESNSRASTIFVELFGDRFPKKKDEVKSSYKEVTTGAKPWGK